MNDRTVMTQAAIHAVAAASAVCRKVQQHMAQIRAITKDDKSPVTVADFASQAVVAHELAGRLGRVHLVGEETSAQLRNPEHSGALAAGIEAAREAWPDVTEAAFLDAIDAGAGDTSHPSFWTLDPIDGTKGFLRNQQYAVALALIEGGRPVIGVLGCPNLARDFSAPLDRADRHGCIYVAAADQGLFEVQCDRPGEQPAKIHRPRRAPGEPVIMCESMESAHSDQDFSARLMAHLGQAAPAARLDSQAKYAVVARGQAHLYLRLPTRKDYVERIWDHAAGSLCAVEAGCVVTDVRGRPLDFSHGRGLEANAGVVCSSPDLHPQVIAAIHELAPST